MTEFFTGCTHFGHGKVIDFANRPFDNVNEMDEQMVRRWNRVVKPRDTVYHLGDFAFDRFEKYLPALNGRIVMLRGNHDDKRNKGDIDMVDYLEIKRDRQTFVLCHYPFEEWNKSFHGSIHLHAHTHTRDRVTGKNRVSVGVDAWAYAPVSMAEILEELKNAG